MHRGSVVLILVMVLIAAAQAQARPCDPGDLHKQVASLPRFIVVNRGEQPRDALGRVLGCDLPAPEPPRLADGKTVQPKLLVGKSVFDTQGESSGCH